MQALAWTLAALAVLLLVPTLVLLGLNARHVDAGRMFADVVLAVAAVAYAGAGRLITSAFAARLKDAVDQDAVRADLLGVVQRSLEPTHAAVWIRPGASRGQLS